MCCDSDLVNDGWWSSVDVIDSWTSMNGCRRRLSSPTAVSTTSTSRGSSSPTVEERWQLDRCPAGWNTAALNSVCWRSPQSVLSFSNTVNSSLESVRLTSCLYSSCLCVSDSHIGLHAAIVVVVLCSNLFLFQALLTRGNSGAHILETS